MVTDASISPAVAKLNLVRGEIGKVIVGQQSVVDGVLICLVAGGHTFFWKESRAGRDSLCCTSLWDEPLGLRYQRISVRTPDLMPADIVERHDYGNGRSGP